MGVWGLFIAFRLVRMIITSGPGLMGGLRNMALGAVSLSSTGFQLRPADACMEMKALSHRGFWMEQTTWDGRAILVVQVLQSFNF
jgi:hypothetical protein